jgi:hypothetical protein
MGARTLPDDGAHIDHRPIARAKTFAHMHVDATIVATSKIYRRNKDFLHVRDMRVKARARKFC